MNTLSIPMVAMAGISLYVGFYHLERACFTMKTFGARKSYSECRTMREEAYFHLSISYGYIFSERMYNTRINVPVILEMLAG